MEEGLADKLLHAKLISGLAAPLKPDVDWLRADLNRIFMEINFYLLVAGVEWNIVKTRNWFSISGAKVFASKRFSSSSDRRSWIMEQEFVARQSDWERKLRWVGKLGSISEWKVKQLTVETSHKYRIFSRKSIKLADRSRERLSRNQPT